MRNTLLCFVFLSFAFGLAAQDVVPGYMGRRLVLGYELDLRPSGAPSAAGYDGGIDMTHSACLEYVIRNRTDLCLGFRHFETGLYHPGTEGYSNTINYEPGDRLPMNLRSNAVTLGFKFFSRGRLAPIGKYRKLGLVLYFNKVTYDKDGFKNHSDGQVKPYSIGSGVKRSNDFAISYELGRQRVFYDRILLGGGCRFSIPFAALLVNSGGVFLDTEHYDHYAFMEGKIAASANNRLFMHEFINVHFGISFLAY